MYMMMKPSPRKPALADALSVILPTAEQTSLLRACLCSGELGRQAWEVWQKSVDEPSNGPREGRRVAKSLRPLLLNALRRNGAVVDRAVLTYLKTDYLTEELRGEIYRRICRNVLWALATENIPAILLKGAALAETVYDDPAQRHCHDIDILVRDNDTLRAASPLRPLGFTLLRERLGARCEDVKFKHESGLPLELHCRLFRIRFYNVGLADMWERSQIQVVVDVPTRILSPADNLLHVCGHASYCASRKSLLWVCDSWLIIDRYPNLDWDVLLDCVLENHLALPLSVMLGYLAKDLNAPVPAPVLDRLYAAASRADTIEREAALLGARAGTRGGFRSLVRMSGGWRARAFVVKWMLFPSPSYLRWVQQIRHPWLLPFYYVYRPLRYIARHFWLRCKTTERRQKGVRTMNGVDPHFKKAIARDPTLMARKTELTLF